MVGLIPARIDERSRVFAIGSAHVARFDRAGPGGSSWRDRGDGRVYSGLVSALINLLLMFLGPWMFLPSFPCFVS